MSFFVMISFPFVFSQPEVYVRFLIAGGTHIFQVSFSWFRYYPSSLL